VSDLKAKFLKANKKNCNDVNRFRFTLADGTALTPNEKALSAFSLPPNSDIAVEYKDLGPQISWRTVFIVEYMFPMLVFPLLWILARHYASSPVTKFIYPAGSASASTKQWQNILTLMFTLHFVKRELETIYVHRFGNETMPLRNIFKNSGYYWMFAAWIAHVTLHPQYTVPASSSRRILGVGLFVICELLNMKTHMDLRNLRPAGTRIRRVPRGILFNLVSCPNYLFEILSWVGFTLASQSVASAVFTVVGAAQMTVWAIAKHRRYRKEFDGQDGREMYPKNRKILIPFVL
jgi:very-long-chain enoyl-CoA reductase